MFFLQSKILFCGPPLYCLNFRHVIYNCHETPLKDPAVERLCSLSVLQRLHQLVLCAGHVVGTITMDGRWLRKGVGPSLCGRGVCAHDVSHCHRLQDRPALLLAAQGAVGHRPPHCPWTIHQSQHCFPLLESTDDTPRQSSLARPCPVRSQ